MRSLVPIVTLLVGALALPLRAQSSLQFHGFVTARGINADEKSWLEGGVGRFEDGNGMIGQAGIDWTPARWFVLHGDGITRTGNIAGSGEKTGMLQLYADFYNENWRLRLGGFWLPTSRENTGPLWTSPYTLTYSALNSWIGQEVRPIGVDLQYSPNFYITLGATAFRGNDTMGTLIAARGWTIGNRLTVYDEIIPSGAVTTRPFGPDLDSENGYAGRIRLQLPERALIQFTRLDNRAEVVPGDPPDEPWLTRYDTIGTTIGLTSPTTFAAEFAQGDTTVGFPGGTFTLNFETIYALISHKKGPNRYSARIEQFSTDSEDGRAYTATWLRDVNSKTRAGVEYTKTTGDNPGSAWMLEMRYAF